MSGIKDYAIEIKQGYNAAIARLNKKYAALTSSIDEEYENRNREISKNAVASKNSLSKSHTLGLANAQKRLLDKGLKSSGESINTELRSNLSKNNAFATVDAEAEHAREQNALSTAEAKNKLLASQMEEEGALTEAMNNALREQYNLDREYEADRADAEESKRQWEYETAEDKRRWDSETAEDKRRWEYESEEDKHRWKTENAQKAESSKREYELEKEKLEAEKTNNNRKNYLAEREFLSAEEQRAIENDLAERKFLATEGASKNGDTVTVTNKDGTTTVKSVNKRDGGVVPHYTADEFIETIVDAYWYEDDRDDRVKRAIYQVLNDTTLSPEYKTQVRVYAAALGYI